MAKQHEYLKYVYPARACTDRNDVEIALDETEKLYHRAVKDGECVSKILIRRRSLKRKKEQLLKRKKK